MISPESLEEERHVGKLVMEGESSEGDSPEQKRMRLDGPEEDDKKMLFQYFHTFPEPFPYPDELPDPAIQEEEDGFPDPAFCEEEEFPDPAFCAIQEEAAQHMIVDVVLERQLLGPHRVICWSSDHGDDDAVGDYDCWSSDDGDDDAVGDYESVDRITVDYELENEKALARVKSIRRAWTERPLTEEECNLEIYRLYGSEDPEDSLAEMDSRVKFCRAQQDRDQLYAEELNKQKVDKVEQILDYKEIQRVDKILQEVVDRTLPAPTVPRPDDIVTDVGGDPSVMPECLKEAAVGVFGGYPSVMPECLKEAAVGVLEDTRR